MPSPPTSSSIPASVPAAPSSSTPAPAPATPSPAQTSNHASEDDLEKLLNRQASALQRELQVERILKAFKLNPYDILDIEDSATPEEIKKRFRQLSIFIHPDKCSHARAPEAFDLLKKAESDLSDAAKRAELDAIVSLARTNLLKALSLPATTAPSDPTLKRLQPSWHVQLREKSKEMLIDEEVRRRKAIKMNLANEGLEARKKEDEVSARKRKAEEDKQWEETREQRVDSWRSFSNNGKKKKKTKTALLG